MRELKRGTFAVVDMSSKLDQIRIYGEVELHSKHRLLINCELDSYTDARVEEVIARNMGRPGEFSAVCNFPFLEDVPALECQLSSVDKRHMEFKFVSEVRPPNQRIALRAEVSLPCVILGDDGKAMGVTTVDVSGGGAQVKLKTPLRKGERITFRMAMPIDDRKDFIAQGHVVWQKREDSHYYAGIAFVDLSVSEIKRVCRLAIKVSTNTLTYDEVAGWQIA